MNEMTNSHILVHDFAYLEPVSVSEAVALLAEHGARARVLAGGTDLLVQMKMERLQPEYVVAIHRISELKQIGLRDEQLQIGSLVSIRAIRNLPYVQTHFPALAEACASFSTTQVQVMGTVGGNLCNGSPASDSAPALIAYGAKIVLQGPDGERVLPLEDFFRGPGKTDLQPGELATAVLLPPPAPGTGSAFLKISRVAADIAKVNAAVTLVRDGNCITACRIAFGSVAPTPRRARQAEAMLVGQEYSEALIKQAADVAASEMAPIDDVRSTSDYRRQMVKVMAMDALERAWTRAGQPPAAAPSGNGFARHKTVTGEPEQNGTAVPQGERRTIELTINGTRQRVTAGTNDLLLNVLREDLELTGTKYGCGIGECSACTVEMNGQPALACLVLALSAAGSEVTTVEGLQGPNGELHRLQEAFLDHAAFQCGFCTPGMLITAKNLLDEIPHPNEDDVRDYLKGNLCRCTGYASIVRAVLSCND